MAGSKLNGYRGRGKWPLPILALAFVAGCGSTIPTAAPPHTTELPFVAETEHFRFYAEARDALDIPRTEAHFSWLLSELRVDVPRKIDYYKYLDLRELARATGRDAPFADAERFEVHTLEPWEREQTTRLVVSLMGTPPTFFIEGLVVAHQAQPFDGGYGSVFDAQPVHRTPAIRLALGLLPPLETILFNNGFDAARDRIHAQLQAGSFVRRLINLHGMETFLRFMRGSRAYDTPSTTSQRFARAYGTSLAEAEREWHGFLLKRALVNAPVGFSDGATISSSGLAAAISFSSNGSVLARTTSAYRSETLIPYEFDVTYHFRLAFDVSAHRYSTFVRAPGEAERLVGTDYGFRVDPNPVPASKLDTVGLGVLVSPLGALGAVRVCNLQVTGSASTARLPCTEVTAGSWRNEPLPLQTGTFAVEFDGTLLEWAAPTPTPSAKAASTAARAHLDELIRIVQANAIHRKQIDWTSFRTRVMEAARGAETVADTTPAISLALDLLDDQHSFFTSASGARPAKRNTRQCEAPVVTAPVLPPDIAYVRVGSFSGDGPAATAFADAIQQQIRASDRPSLSGWIVDLRGNGGGNMWPMIAGLGPVLGEGLAGHFIDPNGSTGSWSYQNGAARAGSSEAVRATTPYALLRPDPRVAVLTDQRVASSGEAVAISFRARPNARSFGTSTCGLSTANRGFGLNDGSALGLTVSVMADRTRQKYGRAIAPDETIYDSDVLLRRAVAWLRTGD